MEDMEVGEEAEGDMELFARSFGDKAVAIPLLEKMMSPQLATKFFQKYTSQPWVAPKFSKMRNVPKLTDICCSFIGKNKHVIDTLFAIYGADTNFPIPSHLVDALTTCEWRFLDDNAEATSKLLLLLINMNTSKFSGTVSVGKNEHFNPLWNELIWKKLHRLSAHKINLLSDHSQYALFAPGYSWIDAVLPYMANFRNVQTLSMSHTLFEEKHILQLASYMPKLKSIYFGFKEDMNTSAVINALAQLSLLEELKLDLVIKKRLGENEEAYGCMQVFVSRCLKSIPKLKIAGTIANILDVNMEHIIPTYDEPTELALEHLVIFKNLDKECANSSLPNVKYLRILELENMQDIKAIVDLGLSKLEELHLFNYCHSDPIMALISNVALTVSVIVIDDEFEGGLDFLRIIDFCPNLKTISLLCIGNGGYCTYGGFEYLQQPHPHLQSVTIYVHSTLNHQLPSGALTRILCAPNLEYLNLNNMKYPDEDCHRIIRKMLSGCQILQKLDQIIYSADETSDIVPVLFATLATFCPKLKTIDCDSVIKDNEVFKIISPALQQVISLVSDDF